MKARTAAGIGSAGVHEVSCARPSAAAAAAAVATTAQPASARFAPQPFDGDGLRLERVKRVCVFRALQLGDMLCAVPALRSLRAGLPDASIALVGLPWARAFVHRFRRYVDELIPFPGHPAMPEQPARPEQWPDFVAAMRARQFDLAVQLHGSGEVTNAVVAEFGAARCAGFCPAPDAAPDPATFLAWEPREPEVDLAGYAELEPQLARLRAQGVEIADLELERPDLEQVFLTLTS